LSVLSKSAYVYKPYFHMVLHEIDLILSADVCYFVVLLTLPVMCIPATDGVLAVSSLH